MPTTRRENQPWYTSLTLDVIIKVLNNSIFHPFVCCLIPLCLRAGETPYTEPVMTYTIGWAIFITILAILHPLSDRIAYGPAREVDHEEEVIVITGGSSGLGRCIAEIYAIKGASVAVLDKTGVDRSAAVENVEYYQCDISDRTQVAKCWKQINKDLGVPTILVNNAAIVHGKSALDLSPEEVNQTYQTNVVSHHYLYQLFTAPLKTHETGGTLVTISSVLGRLGAARLSDYTGSKAALIAMHNSMAAELSAFPTIKTILVTPGQLSTDLFGDIQQGPIANFFGPVVGVSEFAVQLVKMINEGRGGILAEPFYARWIGAMELLPPGAQKKIRQMARLDTAMENFRSQALSKPEDASEESVELL